MDKPSGLLTHAAKKNDYGNNLVDSMLAYLYKTGKVNSRDMTFTPAVVNRLDRNTAGLVIGAKNALALKNLNQAIKERNIDKYYLTLVKGQIKEDFSIDSNIEKNEKRNLVKASHTGKRIITNFHPLETKNNFTVLECQLITGKTHQIRYSLEKNKTPIIGDRKYGDKKTNDFVRKKLAINNQILLAYKLVFGQIKGLEYLSGKSFLSKQVDDFNKIKKVLFDEI